MNKIEIGLSLILVKSRQTIRFLAIRMIEEIILKRRLTVIEQNRLYGKCARGINRPLKIYKKNKKRRLK